MSRLKGAPLLLFVCFMGIYACTDPVEESRQADEKAYQDSLAQADLDNLAMDNFIAENGLSEYPDSVSASGMRFIVVDEGSGASFPATNEILSVHSLGFLTDGTAFESTSREWAMTVDSTSYVEKGVDVSALMSDNNWTLEETLDYLSDSEEALSTPLVSQTQFYSPVSYNQTDDGFGLGTNFIQGYSQGVFKIMPLLKKGGTGYIFIPSAIGFSTFGGVSPLSGAFVDANTPLVYFVELSNIRP